MFKRARSIGFKTTSVTIVLIVSVLLVASVGLHGIGNLTGAVSQTAAASNVLIGANTAEGVMIQYLLTKDAAKTEEAAKDLQMARTSLDRLTLAPGEKQNLSDGIATMETSIRNLSTAEVAVQTAGTALADATAALLAEADKAEKAAGDLASQAETNSNNSFITLNQIRELIQNLVNFNNSVNEIQLLLVGSSTSAYGAPVDAIAPPLAQAKAAMAALVAQGGTPDIQPFVTALADGFARVDAEIARHPGGTFGPSVNLAVFQDLVGVSRKLTDALRTAGDAELNAKSEKDKERSKARIIAGSARNFSNTLKDTLVKVERYHALPTEDGAALVAAGLKKAQSFGKMLSKAAAIDLTPSLEKLNASFTDLQKNLATFDAEAKQLVAASARVTTDIAGTAAATAETAAAQGQQSSGWMWGAGFLSLVLALGIATFMIRSVARPLVRVAEAMTALATGKAEPQVKLKETGDEIGDMVRALRVFQANDQARVKAEDNAARERDMAEQQRAAEQARTEKEAAQLRQATDSLGSALKKLASGDLTCRIETRLSADYEPIRMDFNQAVEQLGDVIRSVTQAINNIDTGTGEIAGGSDALARRTEQQAAALEQTAAALDEITANVGNSTKRTEEARALSDKANKSALASTTVVTSAEDAMQRIEKSSQQISNIIGVIDEIAFQTNLLALNAGVEAARAGDAGKGFAVVAQEVRELAQRSARAAKEIKTLISTSTAEVETGVQLVRGTGEALKEIGSDIIQINQHVAAIATAAREQSVGLAEINTAINQMDQSTQQNAAMVEESSAASSTLASEASRLRELISHFVIDDADFAGQHLAWQREAA